MSNSRNSKTNSARVPSRRDQEIYTRIVVHCELQYQVAKDLGLSPGRVSQILARVRRWLAGADGFEPQTSDLGRHGDAAFSALERQRLQRHLAEARHEYLYEITVREIRRMSQNPKHTTTG